MFRTPACVLMVLVGCGSPEPATPQMEEVVQTLFRDFEQTDALTEPLDDLALLLADVDFAASSDERAFSLSALTAIDVGDAALDGLDPEDCGAVALAYESSWLPIAHSSYQVFEDLSVLGTSSTYDRTIIEPADPSCFPEKECTLIRTTNSIVRESFLFTLTTSMRKDYQWVETAAGPALLERGWLTESSHGEEGNNHLWQTFEVEVWLPSDEGSIRFFAHFADPEYVGISDEYAESMAILGAQGAMEAADEFLEETCH